MKKRLILIFGASSTKRNTDKMNEVDEKRNEHQQKSTDKTKQEINQTKERNINQIKIYHNQINFSYQYLQPFNTN